MANFYATGGAGTITITGTEQLAAEFAALPLKLQKKALRRGVTKAGRRVIKAAKAEAPKETGLLRQSLGSRVYTFKDKSGVGVVVGVRKGFKKPVVQIAKGNRRGQFRKARKTETSDQYRDPSKYLHLVVLGTKNSRPNNFLLRAANQTTSESIRTIQAECQSQISQEYAKK